MLNDGGGRKFLIVVFWLLILAANTAHAQAEMSEPVQKTIAIKNSATDTDVRNRIRTILVASNWYQQLDVKSNSGIVTLAGTTESEDHQKWAESIGYRTENVIAVVNKIQVINPSPWSLRPLLEQSHNLVERGVQHIPAVIMSVLILLIGYLVAKKLSALARTYALQRVESAMLRRLLGKLVALPVMVLAAYLVFNVSGLGSLATTLIGGTGLLGLIIGIAFRDITENFLASILLSIQRPFVIGDMVQVLEFTGMVEAMTTRGTVIITLDGNHVQIPNTIIYKEPITNFSANPNIRQTFTVGIGYDVPINRVQTIILALLEDHEAVLNDPEPLILAEQLAASTVIVGVYFWIDSRQHSPLKVRSSVLRSVKHKLMQEGISMPDDGREIIFPQGIKVDLLSDNASADDSIGEHSQEIDHYATEDFEDQEVTAAEGDLSNDEGMLKQQAKNGTLGQNKTNLL